MEPALGFTLWTLLSLIVLVSIAFLVVLDDCQTL